MKIIIVGNGKLSKSLTKGLAIRYSIAKWDDYDKSLNAKNIVIHTGSGRQLNECVGYCNRTNSILLELSTGTSINNYDIQCPVIVCPNTTIPILKLMYIINKYGKMFRKYKIKITESHQKNKNTIAGTAVDIARSLEVPITEIKSLRDIDVQKNSDGGSGIREISSEGSAVTVLVIPTNEELRIAQETKKVIESKFRDTPRKAGFR